MNFQINASQCKAGLLNGNLAPSSSASKLAEVFPSLLTAEGKKTPPEEKPPTRPPQVPEALASDLHEGPASSVSSDSGGEPPLVHDLVKELEKHMAIVDSEQVLSEPLNPAGVPPGEKPVQGSKKPPPPPPAKNPPPPPPPKKATTAKELRDLMYQHYCVGKGKLKKPSANAIKKGKVPPPACSTLGTANQPPPPPPASHPPKGHDDSTDEMSDDDDDDNTDDTSSETSKVLFIAKRHSNRDHATSSNRGRLERFI